MADSSGGKPQFDTAEYKSQSGDACSFCKAPLSSGYYRLNGKMACASCAQRIQSALPVDSHAKFVRATLFGFGAALLGMAIYAGVEILTNFTIGYLAFAVGFLVAKAMMLGSGGIGGRRYQVVAVALTYFAIAMSIVPVGISQVIKERKLKNSAVQSAPAPTTHAPAAKGPQPPPSSASPEATPPQTSSVEPSAAPVAPEKEAPPMNVAKVIGMLLVWGLASPFLELQANFVSGLIGLVILFVGLQIAWRLAAGVPRVTVEGPY